MTVLLNFYRNVNLYDNDYYDSNSFIGKWIDDGIWHDKEYWKLDKDLEKIRDMYPYPADIPRDICTGLMRIAELMMVSNWKAFSIEGTQPLTEDSIYERFERLKFMLSAIFTGETLDISLFDYQPA